MTTVTKEQHESGKAWATDYYRLLDAGDLTTMTSKYLKPDVVFAFSNLPTMKGREAVIQVLSVAPASPLASMKHNIIDVIVLTDRLMVQLEGHAKFVNGEEETLRAFVLFIKNVDEEQVSQYTVFCDLTPLMKVRA